VAVYFESEGVFKGRQVRIWSYVEEWEMVK